MQSCFIEKDGVTYTMHPPELHSEKKKRFISGEPNPDKRNDLEKNLAKRITEIKEHTIISYTKRYRTIVPDQGDTTYRIDRQNSKTTETNISYQGPEENPGKKKPDRNKPSLTYATVLIDNKAKIFEDERCEKFHTFLENGLRKSFNYIEESKRKPARFYINVTIEQKKANQSTPSESQSTKRNTLISTAIKAATRLPTKTLTVGLKSVGKTSGKSLSKKIPIIGIAVGVYFAVERLADGEYMGAIAEVSSGVLSIIPGLGTAGSFLIDGCLLANDCFHK